jgi:hypothetical protein
MISNIVVFFLGFCFPLLGFHLLPLVNDFSKRATNVYTEKYELPVTHFIVFFSIMGFLFLSYISIVYSSRQIFHFESIQRIYGIGCIAGGLIGLMGIPVIELRLKIKKYKKQNQAPLKLIEIMSGKSNDVSVEFFEVPYYPTRNKKKKYISKDFKNELLHALPEFNNIISGEKIALKVSQRTFYFRAALKKNAEEADLCDAIISAFTKAGFN